jgi:hypothetical protein
MSSGFTIHVSGLAPETSETKLHDFFSFCGKLQSVKKHGTEADITFEKQSAMRTALMLNGGTLDGAHLEVTSSSPAAADSSVLPAAASGSSPVGTEFDQEDKPKAAIAAEYLAHGYTIGDHIIQKAIDVDRESRGAWMTRGHRGDGWLPMAPQLPPDASMTSWQLGTSPT